jgi:diaminohydroxyphosphoribosylaminopyrimidine deaminase/5-amino-6-(5-phosphoribosylamino)uracil reductase
MLRAIELSEKGMGQVAPNPMVGAVLVHNDIIIGEGYHAKYGEAHAEVNCIKNVAPENQHLIKEATLYVTLEPCSHQGKTPPCVDLILANGIKEVVIAHLDPFEKVNGTGASKLRASGVNVIVGILEKEARFMNRRFLTRIEKKRPYIILKWAESADGFMAPEGNEPYWLSSHESKTLTHKWRSEEASIMVGYNTVLHDNPMLTTRLYKGKNPIRVVIDRDATLPSTLAVFDGAVETFILNKLKADKMDNVQYLQCNTDNPQSILNTLYAKKIESVFIEGGAKTLQLFLKSNLWDEICVFKTEKNLFNGLKAPSLKLAASCEHQISTDKLSIYKNPENGF